MNFQELRQNQYIAFFICGIGLYSLVVTLINISSSYHNWQSYFDQSTMYPLLITGVTLVSPLAFFTVAAFVYMDKRNYFIIPLAIYSCLFFMSFAAYIMVALLLYWWFKTNKTKVI